MSTRPTQFATEHLWLQVDDMSGKFPPAQRSATEAFIHRKFARAHGANLTKFMPILLCLRDGDAQLRAALGLRPAQSEKLFLESYLPQPVEVQLSSALRMLQIRSDIIELGNLAISSRGMARSVIMTMTAFLHAANYRWVVFTGGPLLSNSFTRLGLVLYDLGAATAEHLPAGERACWGSYYDQQPRVMACSVDAAHQALYQHCQHEQSMLSLWRQAQHIGRQAA